MLLPARVPAAMARRLVCSGKDWYLSESVLHGEAARLLSVLIRRNNTTLIAPLCAEPFFTFLTVLLFTCLNLA